MRKVKVMEALSYGSLTDICVAISELEEKNRDIAQVRGVLGTLSEMMVCDKDSVIPKILMAHGQRRIRRGQMG